MQILKFTAIVLWLTAATATPSQACTAFQLKSNDGAQIYFRSMEFGVPFHSKILIIPRGTGYTGSVPGGQPGLKWRAKYGVVGLNVDVAPTYLADGQNEKGLAIGMLYLPGYAEYPAAEGVRAEQCLGSWEVPAFLLSTCATVDEALAALKTGAKVVQQEFPPFHEVLPVHWWIGDASGKVAVVEYVGGNLKIHDAPLGVLTNSPTYDWQQINVSNYLNLSPINVPSKKFGTFESINFGQGSGFVGLPGDLTPPSRFVRATLFSHWATPGQTAEETVNLGIHVLNTFDIFNGAVQSNTAQQSANTKGLLPDGPAARIVNTDTTEWIVAHDRTNLKTYVRTYGGQKIQMVDLKQTNFDEPGLRTIELQNDFAPEDITGAAKPLPKMPPQP